MTGAVPAGRLVTAMNFWPVYAVVVVVGTATATTVLPLVAVLIPPALAALLGWRDRRRLGRGAPTPEDYRLAAARHRLLAVLGAGAAVLVALGVAATAGLPVAAAYLLPAVIAAALALWGYARGLSSLARGADGTVASRGAARPMF